MRPSIRGDEKAIATVKSRPEIDKATGGNWLFSPVPPIPHIYDDKLRY